MSVFYKLKLKFKQIKSIFFLTDNEKKLCPQCNNKMFWNSKEHSNDSFARFDCNVCKHFEYRNDGWGHYTYEKITLKRSFLIKHGIFQFLNGSDNQPVFISEYSEVPKITEHAKEELFKCVFNQLSKNHVTQIEFVYKGYLGIDNMNNEQLIKAMLDNHIDPYSK
jgi:hypothetical protein